jgi:hypothetical protein
MKKFTRTRVAPIDERSFDAHVPLQRVGDEAVGERGTD